VVIGVTVLAWTLAHVGVSYGHLESGGRCIVSLNTGRIWFVSIVPPPAKPLDRERYELYLGKAYQFQNPGRPVAGGPKVASIRLDWVLGGAVLVLLAVGLPAWLRGRARARSGRCLACGYQRAPAEGPCSECGVTIAEAKGKTGRVGDGAGRLVRDAGVCLFLVVLAAASGAWWVVAAEDRLMAAHRSQVLDYSWYLGTCAPRLKGAVVVATPGSGPGGLAAVIQRAGSGTTIVLMPGVYELGDMGRGRGPGLNSLKDIWLVGAGREKTTLTMHLEHAERVRIEGLTIDCKDNEFLQVRDQGSIYLRDCLVHNYNSGAGGSEALDVSDAALLVEDCEFEGKSGRNSPSSHGTALELRGDSRVFIRGTRFVNNQEVFRSGEGVLDGCSISSDSQWASPPQGGNLFTRNTDYGTNKARFPQLAPKITETLDDPGPLKRMSEGARAGAWTDPLVRGAAEKLRIWKDPDVWGRLLLSPSPEVRAIARGKAPLAPTEGLMSLDEAMAMLDQQKLPTNVSLSILSAGEDGREKLRGLSESSTGRTHDNAAALLRLMDVQPPLPELVQAEAARPK
jgi:hypothetical protein